MADCKDCPNKGKIKVPFMGGKGASVIFVGESPGYEEEKAKKPFVGESGKLLSWLASNTIDKDVEVILANSARCLIDKEDLGTKEVNKVLACCRPDIEKVIRVVKPKLIVCLGGVALQQILKKQKVLSHRGRFFYSNEFKCQVFITVHPAHVLRSGKTKGFPNIPEDKMSMKEKDILCDFRAIGKFIKQGYKCSTIKTSNYVKGTYKDILELSKKKLVSFDLETTGLNAYDPNVKILCISFSGVKGNSKVYFDINSKGVKKILENPNITKVVAARPFDENMIYNKAGYEVKGKVFDVLTMAHVLDENFKRYDLESITNIYGGGLRNIKDLAEGQRSKLELASKKLLIRYCGVDSDATLRCLQNMGIYYKKDKKLLRYLVKFILPAQDAITKYSRNGCLIDMEVLEKNVKKAEKEMKKLYKEVIALLPPVIIKKYKDNLKLSRSVILIDYLFYHRQGLKLKPVKFTPKTKKLKGRERVPSTDKNHLKLFTNIPFLDLYRRWIKLHKITTSYIKNLPKHIQSDKRVYPSTLLIRQVTGRSSIVNPAIQTFPARGDLTYLIREGFVVDKGWLMGARDLSQSEMRIIGWLAGDKNILQALKDDIDLHIKFASRVNGIDMKKVTKLQRYHAKAGNFGFIYGLSAKGFKIYAKNEYDIDFTIEEAENIRTIFFRKPDGYYALPEYHKRQIAICKKYGYVESPLGRKRRLPDIYSRDYIKRGEAERQAVNMPTQSFSSDLTYVGLFLFQQEIDSNRLLRNSVKSLWMIHDQDMFLAKEKKMTKAMKCLKECMNERAVEYIKKNFGVTVGYPVASDGKTGINWENLKSYKD